MSRRKRRFENRKKKRILKNKFIEVYDNFERISSLEALYKSAKMASKGVNWKASTQKYMNNILFRIWKTRQDLLKGKDIRKGFIKFDIYDRGKTRHIQSVHFEERVVQKSFCQFAVYPIFSRKVILDNYASQKGKGTHFALSRIEKFLKEYIKENGTDGYILKIDFKSYFANIDHDKLKEIYRIYFKDKNILKLSDDFIDAFGERGLGLGSEASQMSAIMFTDKIDKFIKIKYRSFGKYMDDSLIICKDKDELKTFLSILKEKYSEMNIVLNENKTHISKLSKGFIFLKTRFIITKEGKIIKRPCKDAITRERRKLKKQIKLFKNGDITKEEIKQSFESWKGSMLKRNARQTVYNVEKLYKKIFQE